MGNHYVVLFGREKEVCEFWIECQRRVLLYKGVVYKSYTSRDETMQAWALYPPRWKRPERYTTLFKCSHITGHEDYKFMQFSCSALILCFILGSLIIMLFVIVMGN